MKSTNGITFSGKRVIGYGGVTTCYTITEMLSGACGDEVQDVVRNHPAHEIIFRPQITIALDPENVTFVRVMTYGVGKQVSRLVEINEKQLSALRSTWRNKSSIWVHGKWGTRCITFTLRMGARWVGADARLGGGGFISGA